MNTDYLRKSVAKFSKFHVLKFKRLALDSCRGRRDPVCDLARLVNRMHQTTHVFAILHRRQPLSLATLKLFTRDQVALEIERVPRVFTDVPVETRIRKIKSLARAFISE